MITYGAVDNTLYSNNIVIVDSTVQRLYNISGAHTLAIDGGEGAKSWSTIQNICQWLLDIGATKSNTVVAVGGGTIGDSVALACSLYKRGINLVHIPTTLLAMIDSSIGGKTAINVGDVKNAVGTFYNGDCYIDSAFLQTLPQQQIDNGMGEVYKYMLLDDGVANLLQDRQQLIQHCSQLKQRIVTQDPYECGVRVCLNMGHTIAHAIELRHDIPHGEAVACGCHYALYIARHLALVEGQYYDNWHSKVHYRDISLCYDDILAMSTDKKNNSQDITLVLPTNGYGYKVVTLTAQQIASILGVSC